MGSSDEMYQRGAQDAEYDELNPFYYQHYYYYRLGYNTARRQQRRRFDTVGFSGSRLAVGMGALVLVALLAGVAWWMQAAGWPVGGGVASTRVTSERVPTVAAPTVAPPTPTLLPPTAPPPPTLRAGGLAVVVNVGTAQLRARQRPGLTQPVQARIAEGAQVTLLEGPVEADGYIWWRVEGAGGSGWCAERSAEGLPWLAPVGGTTG